MQKLNGVDLTRRRVLAGLGTIGVGAAGAGLGTSAYFNDAETFKNNSLTAGALDLKVDWEEHYYDQSAGGQYVHYSEPTDSSTIYVGLPDPNDPDVWVAAGDLADFMAATSIESFPDPDNDRVQEMKANGWTYDPCRDGADLDKNLDPTLGGNAVRSKNDDTWDSANGTYKPLVSLGDVKPGDFGELTLSFHLCDNPGYVWMQGMLESASENGVTEPEGESKAEKDGTVELLDAIQTVVWYDARGDNVFRTDCGDGKLYLIDSVAGTDTPSKLFEVTLNGGTATLDLLKEVSDNGNFDQTDAIAVTPYGDRVIFFDKLSKHVGEYDIAAGTFQDLGSVTNPTNGIVLAGYSPAGDLWLASQDTDHLYTLDLGTLTLTDRGDTGVNLEGADLVFAGDGTMFAWVSGVGLYEIADPYSDPSAVAVKTGYSFKVTGIAVKEGGNGDLLVSDRDNNMIRQVDRSGNLVASWDMVDENGDPYSYDYGDMDAGNFCGQLITSGSLRDVLDELGSDHGIPLDGDLYTDFDEINGSPTSPNRECFVPGVNHYVGFAWWVPTDVGNEIQTDSVEFDLGFYTEQCRHNSGAGV